MVQSMLENDGKRPNQTPNRTRSFLDYRKIISPFPITELR